MRAHRRLGAWARGDRAKEISSPWWVALGLLVLFCTYAPTRLCAQAPDTLSLHFVDADLRVVVQGIGRYLDKPLLSVGIPGNRVTFETPRGVTRASLPALLRGLAEQQGLELSEDSVSWRLRPKPVDQVAALGQAPGTQAGGAPQLFVIHLKHAIAADMAATVNQLFGGSGAFSGAPGLSRGTLSQDLRTQSAPPVGTPPGLAAVGVASFSGSVTLVPDERTNALLIRASESDFQVVRSAVDQLDTRPLQVLIEVMIVEARKDRLLSFGADLKLPPQPGPGGGTIDGTTTGGGLGDLVLHIMHLGGGDVQATIRAAQTRGDVNIISRPTVLASNNTESRFLVGSQRPFIKQSRLLPTDGASSDQIVEYKDVGTRLTVRPTINQDGYVSLIVQQEVSNATDEVQFGAPVISTREASTTVLVRDGQTIVIGGLRDKQRDRTSGGIPFFSSLPFIGGLFGGISRHETETELYLFLTPRIIRTDDDADQLTRPHLSEGLAP